MVKEEIIGLITALVDGYNSIINSLPFGAAEFVNLFMIVVFIVLYCVFIWKFHKFISRKDIIELKLSEYNTFSHPTLAKLVAVGLYLVEYIIVMPFLIFFWFSVFTIFLVLFTENIEVKTLLIISAAIVTSIRMTAYYKRDLSNDLAKLLPFTILAVSFLNPGFFSIQRVLSQLIEIPNFFGEIVIYLVFIIAVEMVLRFFDFVFSFLGVED